MSDDTPATDAERLLGVLRACGVTPCSARVGRGWCLLPDKHKGDHHAVSSAEWPVPDYGPNRSQTGAKK